MRISVQPLPNAQQMASTAVVVDVLRATSVISLAFSAGAKQIVVCSEIEEAHAIADKLKSIRPPLPYSAANAIVSESQGLILETRRKSIRKRW